ncbi:MAG: GntR family transcriptional regulator [Comamonadaceae bacterium]|nr:MAG: GntR family transcriptional regulator [Comamonadaceae bacterium]
MASQIERVVSELRNQILDGTLAPGVRIRELQYAPELGVSRTPLRLALVELQQQGLLEQVGKRGFQVRKVTLDEVAEAIDLRGVLEGYAARLLAEKGMSAMVEKALRDCIAEGREVLEAAGAHNETLDAARWAAMNAKFHTAMLDGAHSETLRSALEHVMKSPLAATGVLGIRGVRPSLEFAFLRRAQADHEDVLDALSSREGARAESLMREHARRSRDNKRLLAQAVPQHLQPRDPAEAR